MKRTKNELDLAFAVSCGAGLFFSPIVMRIVGEDTKRVIPIITVVMILAFIAELFSIKAKAKRMKKERRPKVEKDL